MYSRRLRFQHLAFGLLAALLLWGVGPLYLFVSRASGAEFATRELKMSDNLVNVTAEYTLSFSGQTAGTVGSIRLQLCSNDPFPGTACTAPAGLDFTSASLIAQSGMVGFSIDASTTANQLVLRRVPGANVAGLVSYSIDNVKNPSVPGTVFGRLETFSSNDATGPSHDAAGLAVDYSVEAVSIQSTVPPYMLFCIGNTIQAYDCGTAAGSYIDFGEFSPTKTSTGQTQMLIATNADYGYTIRALGTTLTSGVNVIPPLETPDVSRTGVSQFGLNLRANTTPPTGNNVQGTGVGVVTPGYDTPNYFKFASGDVLVSGSDPDNFRLFTVSYVANVTSSQSPGIYVSTLQYVALAAF